MPNNILLQENICGSHISRCFRTPQTNFSNVFFLLTSSDIRTNLRAFFVEDVRWKILDSDLPKDLVTWHDHAKFKFGGCEGEWHRFRVAFKPRNPINQFNLFEPNHEGSNVRIIVQLETVLPRICSLARKENLV